MYNKIYNLAPFEILRKKGKFSEEELSRNANISRSTLRRLEAHDPHVRLDGIMATANALNLELNILTSPSECTSELSTVGVSFQVASKHSSWKIYFFNFVDHFRQTLDARLLILPPPKVLPFKLQALLASIVCTLCDEAHIDVPSWAKKRYVLERPWFIAEIESLKASALVESPLYFRQNNIFVLDNFLRRA